MYGSYRVQPLLVPLTHVHLQDIEFAKALAAHSPAVQDAQSTASTHGVDVILGGHDHLYYISKGVTSWEGYDINEPVLGAEHDNGDVLIVKSGTDFRDLSEFVLELEDTPEGSVRKKLIKGIRGVISLLHTYADRSRLYLSMRQENAIAHNLDLNPVNGWPNF